MFIRDSKAPAWTMDVIECPWVWQEWDELTNKCFVRFKDKRVRIWQRYTTRKFTKQICYFCTLHNRKDIRDTRWGVFFKSTSSFIIHMNPNFIVFTILFLLSFFLYRFHSFPLFRWRFQCWELIYLSTMALGVEPRT